MSWPTRCSIYVLHQPIFYYGMRAWRSAFPRAGLGWTPYTGAWFVLAAVLCVALASLTYRWIERPFLVRKARLETGAPVARARAPETERMRFSGGQRDRACENTRRWPAVACVVRLGAH